MNLDASGTYVIAWGLTALLIAMVMWRRTPDGVALSAAFLVWWLALWLLHVLWAPAATLWILFNWLLPVILSWRHPEATRTDPN